MRVHISRLFIAGILFFQVSACDTLNEKINDAIPEIALSDGVLGLNGESGKLMTGTFADAAKTGGIDAVAVLGGSDTFEDLDSGDFDTITSLHTTVGLAISDGDVALTLYRTSASAALLPETIHATNWTLDWVIFDEGHPRASGVRPPGGSAISKSIAVTFTRQAGCDAASASCAYTTGNASALRALFPIEVSDEAYLDDLMAIVGKPVGASNTPNTIDLTLRVTVVETAAQFDGLQVTMRVGEYETTVTPVIFG